MSSLTNGDPPQPAIKQSNARDVLIVTSVMLLGSIVLPPPNRTGKILSLPSPCPFYHMTGLPCPACGLTRSFVCIAHGQWHEAMHWHPLGPVVFLAVIFYWLDALSVLRRGAPIFPRYQKRQRIAGGIGLVSVLVVGFIRMGYYAASHTRF